jgi:malate dehydrogenase (oxaloacetate-decarboxylating)
MEGKALLFRQYGAVDAWPICLATQDADDIVHTVRMIAPVFGGINLEDISAPRCFKIEEDLQDLGIPVFHDDQHGTAFVVLAALTNACRVLGRDPQSLRVVIAGAGAAGTAIARMLIRKGHEKTPDCIRVKEVIVCDRQGSIYPGRQGLTAEKEKYLMHTNPDHRQGSLADMLKGADVFIGVSGPGVVEQADIARMAKDPIVFALSNPEPEIHPAEALAAGAAIVATGRSDYPNQVNNVLAFPGIFRGALDAGAARITDKMKIAAINALADAVRAPEKNFILPHPLDRSVAHIVGEAVRKAALEK